MRNLFISLLAASLATIALLAGTTGTATAGIHQTVEANVIHIQSRSEVPYDAKLILVAVKTHVSSGCTVTKKVWEKITRHPRVVNDYVLKKRHHCN